MSGRVGLLALLVLGVTACAAPASRVAAPEPPMAAAPRAPAAAAAAPEPPRQADQLARIASELAELQNAVAKLMMSARQHDDQLLYLQRRTGDLEQQTRGRMSAFAPSSAMPGPLPPPVTSLPGAPAPAPLLPAPPRATPPASPPPSDVAPSKGQKPPVANEAAQSKAPRATVAAARPAPPAAPSAAAPPSGASASAADALYQLGFEKYQAGDLDGAVVTLYEIVVTFPNDPARERAQFLVGEIFLAQKDYRGAVAELESMIAVTPGGSRVPDALLKLGMAQRSLGDEARARRAWERLVKEHPNSAAARQARTLLRAAR